MDPYYGHYGPQLNSKHLQYYPPPLLLGLLACPSGLSACLT